MNDSVTDSIQNSCYDNDNDNDNDHDHDHDDDHDDEVDEDDNEDIVLNKDDSQDDINSMHRISSVNSTSTSLSHNNNNNNKNSHNKGTNNSNRHNNDNDNEQEQEQDEQAEKEGKNNNNSKIDNSNDNNNSSIDNDNDDNNNNNSNIIDTSNIYNELDNGMDPLDIQGIALLRQIFPKETIHELKQMHVQRIKHLGQEFHVQQQPKEQQELSSSTLSTAINMQQQQQNSASQIPSEEQIDSNNNKINNNNNNNNANTTTTSTTATILDESFLRIPEHIAVRRYNAETKSWQYHKIIDMANNALKQHNSISTILLSTKLQQQPTLPNDPNSTTDISNTIGSRNRSSSFEIYCSKTVNCSTTSSTTCTSTRASQTTTIYGRYFTRVVHRHSRIGLGMTLMCCRCSSSSISSNCKENTIPTRRDEYDDDDKNNKNNNSNNEYIVQIYSVTSNNGQRFLKKNLNELQRQNNQNDDDNNKNNNTMIQTEALATITGPSIDAGIEPGDILIGIDGIAFVESLCTNNNKKKSIHSYLDENNDDENESKSSLLLRHAATIIRYSTDPVVLHLVRFHPQHEPEEQQLQESINSDTNGRDINNDNNNSDIVNNHRKNKYYNGNCNDENDNNNCQVVQYPTVPPSVFISHTNHTSSPSPSFLAQQSLLDTSSFFIEDTSFAADVCADGGALDCGSSTMDAVSYQSDLSTTCTTSTPMRGTQTCTNRHHSMATCTVHPFVHTLKKAGLIKSYSDEMSISTMLDELDRRSRQWETICSFEIITPSTATTTAPTISLAPWRRKNSRQNSSSRNNDSHTNHEALYHRHYVPLYGVRKGLCVRIVNMFLDGTRTAYTLWVYDVETGKEWYAPVRYLNDFHDLRVATIHLCPTIATIPFPHNDDDGLNGNNITLTTVVSSFFRSPSTRRGGAEKYIDQEAKCLALESFIRTMCSMIYKEKLHPNMAEVAIHVQSFLGCDTIPNDNTTIGIVVSHRHIQSDSSITENNETISKIRVLLKRSIQLHTYRIFLLDTMSTLVATFVSSVRIRGPRRQDIEMLEAQGGNALKARAMEDLGQIQAYLDKLQDIIIDGCMDDFRCIAERNEYRDLHELINGNKGTVYWDRLVREAVREQIEIEVYVPLRSVVSRWLVSGWRHEDMEVQFKIKELRKRPQSFFKIPESILSPSNWSSVSSILNDGVGLSTLPCAKLRAIVDAAREISNLLSAEQTSSSSSGEAKGNTEDNNILLGADDFLPIFIYCMVQSEMERPCALCVLLHTLCDRINKIGEIGYYLASFEAAIVHFQEIDLTEGRNEMPSFLSVPLDDDDEF